MKTGNGLITHSGSLPEQEDMNKGAATAKFFFCSDFTSDFLDSNFLKEVKLSLVKFEPMICELQTRYPKHAITTAFQGSYFKCATTYGQVHINFETRMQTQITEVSILFSFSQATVFCDGNMKRKRK